MKAEGIWRAMRTDVDGRVVTETAVGNAKITKKNCYVTLYLITLWRNGVCIEKKKYFFT